MEASALARPIIGADIGGIPELIRPGETGFVFESGNVESLAEVLEQRSAAPAIHLARHRHGGSSSGCVSDFSPSAYRDRMFALYQDIGVNY